MSALIPPPMTLPAGPLQGFGIRLLPYTPELYEPVRQSLDCDPEAWQLFAMSGQGEHFAQWWSGIEAATRAGTWLAYAIEDQASGRIVGTTSLLNITPVKQTVEIGATFLHPSVRSGHVNPASKLLLLQHAFGHGARRVQLLTDLRNLRSQAAIAKLGAVREGVMRRERVIWTGHCRDTVMFAITDLDWPAVQSGLQARLATAPQV